MYVAAGNAYATVLGGQYYYMNGMPASLGTAQSVYQNGWSVCAACLTMTQLAASVPTTLTSSGGVIYGAKTEAKISVSQSSFSGNKAVSGAVISLTSSVAFINVTGSVNSGQNASSGGFAAAVNSTTRISMLGCTVTGNTATTTGAVLSDMGGASSVTIQGGTYRNNKVANSNPLVPSYGGVAFFDNTKAQLTVAGAQFAGNSAGGGEGYGGVAYFLGGSASVLVSSSNFTSNSAGWAGDGYGGVMHLQGGAYGVSISGSTFRGNRCVFVCVNSC